MGKGLIIPADGDVPSMRGQIQGVIYVKPDMLAKREGDVVGIRPCDRARGSNSFARMPAKTKAYLKKFAPALSDAASAAMLASYLPVVPTNAKIGVIYYEKALNFHKITGFRGPQSGNGYADVVATSIIDKAAKLARLDWRLSLDSARDDSGAPTRSRIFSVIPSEVEGQLLIAPLTVSARGFSSRVRMRGSPCGRASGLGD